MALVNIDSALADITRLIQSSSKFDGVQVLSYKRNRSVTITPVVNQLEESIFLVEENGYVTAAKEVTLSNLKKHLRVVFKREFPRSRKVRLIKLEPGTHGRYDLKKI